VVHPPQYSHLGNHLLNKNGIGISGSNFKVSTTYLRLRNHALRSCTLTLATGRAWTNQGMRDVDHEHGQVRTVMHWPFMDIHEVFEPPVWFRVAEITLQWELKRS